MTSTYTKIPDNQTTEQYYNFFQAPMQDYLKPNDHFFNEFQNKMFTNNANDFPSSTDSQESPENVYNDDLSSYSGSHPSTKCSPEYSYPTETDRSGKNSKVTPIIRKGIHKYYEPIRDGNIVFKYEDNPSEYKKARKRIQNRESATRVRNRKKNYVEELEDEMNRIRAQQTEIQSKFCQVQQENNFLKQQLFFLQKKLGLQQPQENVFYQPQPKSQVQQAPIQQQVQQPEFFPSYDDCSVPVHRNNHQHQQQPTSFQNHYEPTFEDPHHHNPQFERDNFVFRTLPKNLKTHTALLGVFTMIICINFVSRAASEFTGAGTRLNTITVLDNETISEANNVNTVSNPNKTAFHVNKLNWTSVLGFIMEGMNVFAHGMSNLPKNAQYLFGFLYLGYAVYVLVMINWAYLTKMSKKQ